MPKILGFIVGVVILGLAGCGSFPTAHTPSAQESAGNRYLELQQLARQRTATKDYTAALGYMNQAITELGQINPPHQDLAAAYEYRSEIKQLMNDRQGQMEDLGKSLAQPRNSGTPLYLKRAKLYEEDGQYAQALSDFANAAKKWNGYYKSKKEYFAKFDDATRRVLAQYEAQDKKNNPQAFQLYQQADAKFSKGDYAAAIPLLNDSIARNPQALSPYFIRASSYSALKNHPAALRDADVAINRLPDVVSYRNLRGAIKDAMGDLDGAKADLTVGLNNTYTLQKPLSDDLADVEEKIEARDHPNAHALMQSGLKKHAAKNYTGAIADFTAAIAINPKYPDYFWYRALSESQTTGDGRFERWYKDALKARSLGHRSEYLIAVAESEVAKADSYPYINYAMYSAMRDADFSYQYAVESDPGNRELRAISLAVSRAANDLENKVRYPQFSAEQKQQWAEDRKRRQEYEATKARTDAMYRENERKRQASMASSQSTSGYSSNNSNGLSPGEQAAKQQRIVRCYRATNVSCY